MRRLIICSLVVLALAVPATARAESVTSTLVGGALSLTASNVSFANATLTGSNQTVTANASSAWTAIDARGTGAAWSLSISATTPTSAAGTVETTARTIAISNMSVSTGSFTAGTGSDATSNLTGSTNLALSTSSQTLASASGTTKGAYTFTPSFSFTIPANAYRSNYAGTVGSSSLNPYTSTITVTIA